MNQWIESKPGKFGGKPCIKGTRISVEFILELMASGATKNDILRDYSQLTSEGLAAAIAYAAKSMKNEIVWDSNLAV